ncbi:hypothetical protein KUTeg_016075 [Tegillarca granosa]|uniref:Cytochrome P450 n=1 Tax=Tegillarca granosa TaxID=220873 RepID=A0ABQ9EPN3_TEGGR|nr:hypothetical protein KUTeg_016075 [Tegillarca granosa]
MATSRTTNVSKSVMNNFALFKRVVSTSAPSQKQMDALTTAEEYPTMSIHCPFRNVFEAPEKIQTVATEPTAFTEEQTIQSFDNIPGPTGLPVVGTLFQYLKKNGLKFNKMFEVYRQRSLEFGPIYKEKIATISSVVISDPEEYSKVIRAEGKFPNRREMEPMAYYRQKKGITLGLVNASVVHKKMLKLKEVMNYCDSMDEVGNDFVKHIYDLRSADNEVDGLEKELFKWAMESIGTFLFEERIGCFGSPTPERAQTFIDNLQDNVLASGRSFVEKKLKELKGNEINDDAKNPKIQEKLYQETKRVLPNNEPITPEKLTELTYIKAVLKETFRVYPITFATSRFVENDLEVGGYNIPAGTHVQANLYGMFRDPKLFPDPREFKPERWLKGNMSSNIKALSNLIWGHGARMCIGNFYNLQILVIVQNFKLEYHHEDIEPVLNTVMTPDRPLKISFVPRK